MISCMILSIILDNVWPVKMLHKFFNTVHTSPESPVKTHQQYVSLVLTPGSGQVMNIWIMIMDRTKPHDRTWPCWQPANLSSITTSRIVCQKKVITGLMRRPPGPLFTPLNPLYSLMRAGVSGPPLKTNRGGRPLEAVSSIMISPAWISISILHDTMGWELHIYAIYTCFWYTMSQFISLLVSGHNMPALYH